MTKADLKAVPDVDIDEGVFKYVYIRYGQLFLVTTTLPVFSPQGVL